MKIYDFNKDKVVDIKDNTNKMLQFLYNTIVGRFILKFITRPVISKIYGKYNNSYISTYKINSFIKKNNINISDYLDTKYSSFNDFFTRKIKDGKRNFSLNKNDFCSLCDSKLMLYKINDDLTFKVKNSTYTVSSLVQDEELAKKYINGICAVFRLSVDDYHRYYYFDDGKVVNNKKIAGLLHTVNPIAYNNYSVFSENSREVTVLDTNNFGKIVQIEVGALMVGKIVNYEKIKFTRGQEKGYFEFGGSTIILLIPNDAIKFNDNIWEYSNKNIETRVYLGDTIGISNINR